MHLFITAAGASLLFLGSAIVGKAEPGRLLFHDPFESTTVKGGATITQPVALAAGQGGGPGGRLSGPVTLGQGKLGKGAKFSGISQIQYQPVSDILEPSGGELQFWVKLHFDPMESNDQTRTVLRNQLFLSLWDTKRGYSNVSIYNAGRDTYAVCVMNAARNIVFYQSFSAVWRPGQWHRLKLTWGRELALWCDGEKRAGGPFHGLFGPVAFDLATTVLYLGTQIGYSDIHSEFTLDELTIRGPAADHIARRPRITLPLLSGAPPLDGRLDGPFWRDACRVQGFLRFPTDELAALQPYLLAAYTAEGLWLGIETTLPAGASPRAILAEHDSQICSEDTVEFFLQPDTVPATDFFQFMASAIGTRYDARHTGGKADVGGYNPEWKCAAGGAPGRWRAEAFIPFTALGLSAAPAAGTLWRANFCVDSAAGVSHALTWAHAPRSFGEPLAFGEILFGGKPRTVRQELLRGFPTGEPLLTFNLVGDFPPIITMTGELADGNGANLFRNSLRLRDTKSIDLRPPVLTTGKYLMSVEGRDETGQEAFYQSFRFETAKAFDVAVSKYPYAGHVLFRANTQGVGEPVEKVNCAVAGPGGKAVGDVPIVVDQNGSGEARFSIRNLAPGLYTMTATVVSKGGKALDRSRRSFKLFPEPAWWGNGYGLDHSVPPPYQPVRVAGRGVSVWGRDFAFAGTVFPKQIRNQGVDMFRRPPVIRLRTGGRTADLAGLAAAEKTVFADAVTLTARQNVGALAVTARSTLEFDGFLRCDLTLAPAAAPATVEALVLEIPLSGAIGRFLLTSNGGSSSIRPLDGEAATPFLPYAWLGNDDMGLAWCADSDRFWTPDAKRAIVARRGADAAALRVNFVTRPVTLAAPAVFSFGIMPSPVRPIPVNDPYAFPSYSASGSVTFSEFLTYPVPGALEGGTGTLEFWLKRSEPKAWSNTALFRIGGQKAGVQAFLITPDRPEELVLVGGEGGRETLLAVSVPVTAERFTHLAFVFSGGELRCYADGRCAGSGTPAAAARLLAALRDEGARLQLGCVDDFSGYTGIVLDELRVSKSVRYRGDGGSAPEGPLAADADTLILDHFEDDFRPDGQDARTAGGGVPSIGSVFVRGKFGRGLKLQVAPPRPGLDVLREMGVKVCTHWEWQPEMAACYGQPVLLDNDKLVPGLKESLRGWKQRGIPNLPYMAFPAISSTSGLIERYGDEWETLPASTLPWQFPGAPPNYYFLNCCQQARGYADYFAAGTLWVMDEIGFDGFYSDGLTNITACQNEAHGCGYRDREGRLHPTYPFFATRETLKRMYRLVKARDPSGLVVNHCSFNLMTPILSFSDIVYTGEHEDYENPLTARLRFSGKPWGLYVTLLGSSRQVYEPLHAMAPLLSGSSVWGSGINGRNDFGRKDAALRAAYRAFDTKTARWSPWWENQGGACRTDDPKVRVSFYFHPGKDVLLLAGNFNAEDKVPAIRLDLARCGLAGRQLAARNVLTGVPVVVSADGRFSPMIRGKSFVLLRLE
jgi:hypothetical protein